MLKRFLQKVASVMTKTISEETSTAAAALHGVQDGRVEKATTVDDGTKKERTQKKIKLHKYAMLMAYQGKEYFGMQIQLGKTGQPTIESHLIDAMCKLGWIKEEQREKPGSFYFQRAARTDKAVSAVRQICGMQLPSNFTYEATGSSQLNELLPSDIRVVAMRRTTNFFHPQKMCDARTYSYTLPTFAFAKPDQLTNSTFRISQEVIDEVNALLDIYVGTHNFYNYTSKKEFADRSCNRYITSFQCGQPFIYKDQLRDEDVEFITITVKGQSFILHQIRKMVGMVITVVREFQNKSYIQTSFEGTRVDVPKAPGLSLLLERVHYDYYDRKHAATHAPLTIWGDDIEAEVERIKFELITKEILETELSQQSMLKWLADLVHHDFSCNAESDEPPKKSFVTMAAAQANKSLEEESAAAVEAAPNSESSPPLNESNEIASPVPEPEAEKASA